MKRCPSIDLSLVGEPEEQRAAFLPATSPPPPSLTYLPAAPSSLPAVRPRNLVGVPVKSPATAEVVMVRTIPRSRTSATRSGLSRIAYWISPALAPRLPLLKPMVPKNQSLRL
jgi:hypothetical protein